MYDTARRFLGINFRCSDKQGFLLCPFLLYGKLITTTASILLGALLAPFIFFISLWVVVRKGFIRLFILFSNRFDDVMLIQRPSPHSSLGSSGCYWFATIAIITFKVTTMPELKKDLFRSCFLSPYCSVHWIVLVSLPLVESGEPFFPLLCGFPGSGHHLLLYFSCYWISSSFFFTLRGERFDEKGNCHSQWSHMDGVKGKGEDQACDQALDGTSLSQGTFCLVSVEQVGLQGSSSCLRAHFWPWFSADFSSQRVWSKPPVVEHFCSSTRLQVTQNWRVNFLAGDAGIERSSWNHRMAWGERAHEDCPVPTLCHGQGCHPPAQLPRAPSNLALNASRDGAPQLLWAAVPVPHCPLSREFLPNT